LASAATITGIAKPLAKNRETALRHGSAVFFCAHANPANRNNVKSLID
jgi:hypothetical protein